MHGGTLAASSEGKNRGATFIVRLPLQIEGTDSGGGGESKNGTETCTNEGRKKSPESQFLLGRWNDLF
jgi:hypothetical protein